MELTSEHIQILLIEKITGTIDPNDNKTLECLLAEDAEVRSQWLLIQKMVEESEVQGFSLHVSETKRWQEVKARLRKQGRIQRMPFLKAVSVAAVLAAAVVGIYLFVPEPSPLQTPPKTRGITLSMENGRTVEIPSNGSRILQFGTATFQVRDKELLCPPSLTGSHQWNVLAVPAALDYKVRLADGTEVWLNAESKLRFPLSFSGSTREVYIYGEAYFKVAKDSQHPFIVHTPQTDIQVTGTAFNVNTYNKDHIQTALVEGSVLTRSVGRKPVYLKPGFAVTYTTQKGFRTETFDETEVLSWMKGVYYFHNTPLQELAKVLSRWYGVEVRFENATLQNKTFSGELIKQEPLQLFLENLKLSAEVSSLVKEGVVYLK